MANIFSQLLGKTIFQKKGNSVLALDIGSSAVKAVQLRKEQGRVILETYGEIATGPYGNLAVGQAAALSNEKTSELLKDLMRETNITTTSGSIAVPLRSSLLITLEVPDMPKADLEKAIPIEARKYIPVPISEVELDWWIIPRQVGDLVVTTEDPDKPEGAKILEVLVVAIHKDTIRQLQDISANVALTSNLYEIETFSAIRSVMHNDLMASVMVDMGAGSTKVAIVDYGIVRLSHTINKGSQDVTMAISRSLGVPFAKAEEIKRRVGLVERVGEESVVSSISPVTEYIFSELNRVVLDYQKKHNRSVGRIILIGGGA
ncbi:MAG TPA: pilus assembly protein PilM, partial [Candidatus Paceibacterota bacterium]|nr:pilus assembly protein PilM [Candidatus Paceibacterota bacterium]